MAGLFFMLDGAAAAAVKSTHYTAQPPPCNKRHKIFSDFYCSKERRYYYSWRNTIYTPSQVQLLLASILTGVQRAGAPSRFINYSIAIMWLGAPLDILLQSFETLLSLQRACAWWCWLSSFQVPQMSTWFWGYPLRDYVRLGTTSCDKCHAN